MDFAYGTEKNFKPTLISHGAKTVSEEHTCTMKNNDETKMAANDKR